MTVCELKPMPDTSFHGPVLSFDFPGMRIGVAEYAEGPTGTTVLHFPERAKAAVDVRGGFPGTFNVDMLRMGYDTRVLDAVVISGGSIYGLEAASGVADALKADGYRSGDITKVGFVSGAIIFDLGDRSDIARNGRRNLFVLGTLKLEEVPHLEWSLALINIKLRVLGHRTSMHPEHA